MKWRFGGDLGSSTCGVLWARRKFRLYRVLPCGGGWGVTGLVGIGRDGQRAERRFATVYGARMAAEAAERKRRAS